MATVDERFDEIEARLAEIQEYLAATTQATADQLDRLETALAWLVPQQRTG